MSVERPSYGAVVAFIYRTHSRIGVVYYALAVAIVSGATFLITPLLIRFVDQASFVSWVPIETLILSVLPLSGLGIPVGALRYTNTHTNDTHDTTQFGAIISAHALLCLATSSIGAIMAFFISKDYEITVIVLLILLFEGIIALYISNWRAQNRPFIFLVYEGGRSSITLLLVLTVYSIFQVDNSIVVYLIVRTVVSIVFAILAFCSRTSSRLAIDIKLTIKLVSYGGPIVIASMLAAYLLGMDRLVIVKVGTTTDVTNYVAHVKLAQLLLTATSPFFIWLAPIAIRALSKEEFSRSVSFMRKSTYLYSVFVALVAGNMAIAAPCLFHLLFPDVEYDQTIFRSLIFGFAIFAFGNPVSLGSLKSGLTYVSVLIAMLAVGTAQAALSFLPDHFGIWGVIQGRSVGLLVYVLAFALHTEVSLKVGYAWLSMAYVLATAYGILFVLDKLVDYYAPLSVGIAVAVFSITLSVAATLPWRSIKAAP